MLNKKEVFAIIFILAFALLGGILRLAKKPAPEGAPALLEGAFTVRAASVPAPDTVSVPTVQKININRATLEELVKLDGVGEKTARNILEFRERRGGFKAVGDLLKVKGIGPKKFERLAPHVDI